MPKMSFAPPIDGRETLTHPSEEATSEHPGLTEARAELSEALAEAKTSRNAHRKLRRQDFDRTRPYTSISK